MHTTTSKPSRNLWPLAIVTWFIIFGSALVAWVSVTVRLKTDLVSNDYYEQEVRFQHQLDRLNRTTAIRSQISIAYDAQKREVTLHLPPSHLAPKPTGQIHFYRPSHASLDHKVPLAVDAAGFQNIPAGALRGGLWNVRLQWTFSGAEYFLEQVIVVDEPTPDLSARPAKLE